MHISGQTKSENNMFWKYCIETFASCYHLPYLCSRGCKRIDLADFTPCRINLHAKSICWCKSYLSSPKVLILKHILNLQDLDGVKKVWSWCCLFWRKALRPTCDYLVLTFQMRRGYTIERTAQWEIICQAWKASFSFDAFCEVNTQFFFLTLNFSYFCLIFLLLHKPILYNRKSCLVFYLYSRH